MIDTFAIYKLYYTAPTISIDSQIILCVAADGGLPMARQSERLGLTGRLHLYIILIYSENYLLRSVAICPGHYYYDVIML